MKKIFPRIVANIIKIFLKYKDIFGWKTWGRRRVRGTKRSLGLQRVVLKAMCRAGDSIGIA